LLNVRRHEPSIAELPPSIRAEIEADEALEPEDEDVEDPALRKDRGDEYV
jgi:hypothetical protein